MTENNDPTLLEQHLKYLKLSFMREHHQDVAKQAAKKMVAHSITLSNLHCKKPLKDVTVPLSAVSVPPGSRLSKHWMRLAGAGRP